MNSFLFDTSREIVLEDDRVLLRPLVAEDYEHLVPFALQEPNLWQYSMMKPSDPDKMKAYIEKAIAAREAGHEYAFIVWDKHQETYAGSTRFYQINNSFGTMLLGYTWYGARFQGTRLNKHCKYLLLSFAFDQLGFERVEFRADNNNARSIAAMKSIGCTVEGILRADMPGHGGGRRDSIVLSILKSEWQDSLRANLAGKLLPVDKT